MNDPQSSREISMLQHTQSGISKFKKSKIFLLVLVSVSILLLIGLQLIQWITQDDTGPVITCPEGVLEASVVVTDAELLEGVSALDNRDGDLSNNIVVETLSPMNGNQLREVPVAVMDLSGNVSRTTRTIHYTDYEKPHIFMSRPLRISSPDELWPLLEGLTANSVLDGDLSAKIKYSFTNSGVILEKGTYALELRVDDSTGTSMVIPANLEIYDSRYETIHVELKEYILYLHVGDTFIPEDYFGAKNDESAQPLTPEDSSNTENTPLKKDEELFIDSNVDTSVPGVYHVTYTVENETAKAIGKSCLIVVVE